nr:DNA-processing protein DprA [uncultured Porphyromonas sp.]
MTDLLANRLIDLLALQQAGLARRELLQLFDPAAAEPELGLDIPPLLHAYEPELEQGRAAAWALLERCEELGISLHPIFAPSYPQRLQRLGAGRPLVLYSLGNSQLLEAPSSVCIVGTRQPDAVGAARAYQLGYEAARRGAVVISGLARGCDAEAHRGALSVGGATLAVVATGLDMTYPEEHAELSEQLLAHGGLLLSEYPPGVEVARERFVQRDRLLAALADEVQVVQCGLDSGTLHTARVARRLYIPIAACRYASYTELSRGNEYLLESGLARPLD